MTFEPDLATAAEALDQITRFVVRQTAVLREVSFTAVSTLSTLAHAGPHRLTELAVHEGVSQPSMTAMVSRLERHGLIERRTDPSDGRIVLVSITDAGRDMLRRRQASRVAFLASLADRLDDADKRALVQAAPALQRLTDPAAVPTALSAAKQAATVEDIEK